MEFYYRFGKAETNKPWDRPTWERFYQWWDRFKTIDGVSDYDFHVVGGALYDIENTWDVDVAITGPVKNFKVLGDLITKGRQMGFDMGIFVDIFWYHSIDFCYEEIIEGNIKYYLKGTLKGDEIKMQDGEVVLFVDSKNGLVPKKNDNEDMVFYFVQQPSEKHLKKPEGYNKTPPVKLEK